MQDQPTLTPAEEDHRNDQAILNLLVDPIEPWSIEEVIREIGDRVVAIDGLDRLYGVGLIHRCHEFVFATRAARGYYELME